MVLPIGCLVNVSALAQLGVGKLRKYDDLRRAVVYFGDEGDRIIAPNTSIIRAKLSSGAPVRFRIDPQTIGDGVVVDYLAKRGDGGFIYQVRYGDEVHDVWEGHIMPAGQSDSPLELLKLFRWAPQKNYTSRWSVVDLCSRLAMNFGGLPAMLGARVLPLGHQIYAARRVLFDRTQRFILADEVGLGKTIEAGMVIQALQAERDKFNVLIIAPGSMSRQWLTETYLRFGARAYSHVDCARVASESRASLGRIISSERLIVATTALEAYPELRDVIAERSWDMVVVDEAHQIPPDHSLYQFLQVLAAQSEGLLLLSATPSKRDMTGLLGLLTLIAPDSFSTESLTSIQAKYDRQSAVWDRLNFTRKLIDATATEGRKLDHDELQFVAGEWVGLIAGDDLLDALLERMCGGEAEAALELVAYVQEFHRLDHRIIRTRRTTLASEATAWPKRTLAELEWKAGQAEAIFLNHLEELPRGHDEQGNAVRVLYQRFCSTSPNRTLRFLELRRKALEDRPAGASGSPMERLAADAGPNDEPFILAGLIQTLLPLEGEDIWLPAAIGLAEAWQKEGGFSRADLLGDWLDDHLREPENQVLVFVQDAEAVNELADRLCTRFGQEAIGRFHCRIDEVELASTAFKFQHNRSCRVLVSDELGGEGRNFQNASAVVHFDVPVSCARLEQRIGRLDRVGREANRAVLSVVLQPANAADRALFETHRDVFQVFRRSIGGLEFVLPRLQFQVLTAYGEHPSSLRDISSYLGAEVATAYTAADEAFDVSLDATKVQLDRSIELAAEIEIQGNSGVNAATFGSWASSLGITARRLDGGMSEFNWTNGSLNVSSELLKIGAGTDDESRVIRGTFSRTTALARDDLQFFAPGHSLIDAMIFEAEHGRHSRATVFALEGFPKHKGTYLLQVLARSILDERLWQGHEIGPGLAARARAFLLPEVSSEIMLLRTTSGAQEGIVAHAGIRSALDHPRYDLKCRNIDPSMMSQLPFLSELWSSIDKSVPFAMDSIAKRRAANARQRADALEVSLRNEIGFLSWQARNASDDVTAIAFKQGIEARQALIHSVREPRTDLFGLALVALV